MKKPSTCSDIYKVEDFVNFFVAFSENLNFKGRFLTEKKQMILVETESENLDDGNLPESNWPPCPPASDIPDLQESCEAPSVVISGHPYSNKRMTLVHLRQIDGNCYKVTEDVDPSAEYQFRKFETEMDDSEIKQFESDWIEFWQPKITKKQIEDIHKKIK